MIKHYTDPLRVKTDMGWFWDVCCIAAMRLKFCVIYRSRVWCHGVLYGAICRSYIWRSPYVAACSCFAPFRDAKYWDKRVCIYVCLSVCPSARISQNRTSKLHVFLWQQCNMSILPVLYVSFGQGSSLRWTHTLRRTSGLVYDEIFCP